MITMSLPMSSPGNVLVFGLIKLGLKRFGVSM